MSGEQNIELTTEEARAVLNAIADANDELRDKITTIENDPCAALDEVELEEAQETLQFNEFLYDRIGGQLV